ncbi:MAG: serine/threonine-protein kinase [Verrucomicrobiota bacterium]
MPTTYTQLQAGDTIGKCEIVRLLGKGGMGAVYLARHTTLDIFVAVKTLAPESISEDKREANRFIREAKLAAQIRHPNVVAIMDADQDEERGFYYIVMEYVDGGSLAEYLKGEALDPEWVFSVIYQIAQALQEASRFGVVHRDIKPHNIMVNNDGVAKLADLGLAKSMSHESVSLTVMGSALGTPAYMSPQQAADAKTADVRDDIYSLGATLYECLTGVPPFEGESVYSVITKVVTRTPENPRKVVPDAPPALVAICGMMMARQREDRYRDADALMADLEQARMYGLDELNSLAAADFLDWGGGLSTPADPNAVTEMMSPSEFREAGVKSDHVPPLTQQAILPAAQEPQPLAEAGGLQTVSAQTVPVEWVRKRRNWGLLGGLAVVLLVLAAGAYIWLGGSDAPPATTPPVAAAASPEAAPAPAPAVPIGALKLTTQPPGAQVLLNNTPPQISPAHYTEVPTGIHTLEVKKEGYVTKFVKVTVEADQTVEPPTVELHSQTGAIVVVSDPAGAVVRLPDGREATTPATFRKVRVGQYNLSVSKKGYDPANLQVEVKYDKDVTPPTVVLTPRTGGLVVPTVPHGAEVTVAGHEPVTSPEVIPALPPGKHQVRVELAGYVPQEFEVEIKPGETTPVKPVALKPLTAKIKVEPNLKGTTCTLYAGDSQTPLQETTGPADFGQLKPGAYRLKVTAPSDIEQPLKTEIAFELKGGEDKVLRPKLEFGGVSLSADPPKTMVWNADEKLGFAPHVFDRVPVGEVTFRFGQPGYEFLEKTIIVKAGESSQLRVELERKKASNDEDDFRPPYPPSHGPGGPRGRP